RGGRGHGLLPYRRTAISLVCAAHCSLERDLWDLGRDDRIPNVELRVRMDFCFWRLFLLGAFGVAARATLTHRTPARPWLAFENPKGIVPSSPGLRGWPPAGTELSWVGAHNAINPKGFRDEPGPKFPLSPPRVCG